MHIKIIHKISVILKIHIKALLLPSSLFYFYVHYISIRYIT